MKNRNLARVLALVLVLCMGVMMLSACQKAPVEETAAPSEAPAESAEPTEAPAEEGSDTPLVVGYSPFSEKFSPFYAETAYDQDVVSMTSISPLTTDRQGAIVYNAIEGETRSYNGTDYFYNGPADVSVVKNDDGTTTYTIPGADVIGDIVINSNKQVKLPETYKVTFAGTGAGDAAGESTVQEKANYTFTVAKQKNFEYTITATMGGKNVTITEGADNTYTITKVTGDLVITIEKKSTLTMEVAVSEYVQMDNKTVFLVTVTGTPEVGKAFSYGDNVMYKTTAYGENVYSWLVIVDKGEAFTVATAEANITQASATAEEVKQSYDVNETGVVDINDAQLTYDIYSGKYTDFEKVSVRKFLRADVNLDKTVNSTDAVAVVKNSK